tara:strand:- start:365 stop:2038 length:1674 start_codon:yes stop_codon:yes gene_type:complete
MAKQVVDGIIKAAIEKGVTKKFKDIARDYVGRNNCHYITLTKQNFHDSVFYGSINALKREELLKAVKNKNVKMKEAIDNVISSLKNNEPALEIELEKIVDYIWDNFKAEYNSTSFVTKDKAKPSARQATGGKDKAINLWIPNMPKDPQFRKTFLILFNRYPDKVLTKSLESVLVDGKETSEGYTKLRKSTQFLHKGTRTTGTEQLEILHRTLHGKGPAEEDPDNPKKYQSTKRLKTDAVDVKDIVKAIKNSLSTSRGDEPNNKILPTVAKVGHAAAVKVIKNLMENMSTEYEQDEDIEEGRNSSEFFRKLSVYGTLGPNVLNPSGGKHGEPNDWSVIYNTLVDNIFEEMQKDRTISGLITREDSQPTIEKVGHIAVNNVLKGLQKEIKPRKGLKVYMPSLALVEKAKNFNGTIRPKKGSKKKIKGAGVKKLRKPVLGAGTSANRSVNKRRTTGTNISLIALLNKALPQTVIDNMSPPSLQNRTGRFAASVRAVSISAVGGQPNIVYTYDRDPYGVFEVGTGDSRWATKQRDPRSIIDKSIREIAAETMRGRFVTTRM